MIGKRIRELRLEKGLSQQQVAELLGTTQKTISKYENETVDLDTATVLKLSEYFEVTTDYLLGKTDY